MSKGKRKPAKKAAARKAPRRNAQRAQGASALAKAKATAERAATRARATAKGLRLRVGELEAKLRKRPARNPRRPPRGWWQDCMARVEARGGKHVRSARAVCGADWWNMPAAKRRAVVERLERQGNDRAAYALAKAERAHNRRRRNPPARVSNPTKELVEVVYREKKPGDARAYDYEHKFAGRRPRLVERNGRLQIHGGSYAMKDGWIHG